MWSKISWPLWRILWTVVFMVSQYTFHFATAGEGRIMGTVLMFIALNELFEPRKRPGKDR